MQLKAKISHPGQLLQKVQGLSDHSSARKIPPKFPTTRALSSESEEVQMLEFNKMLIYSFMKFFNALVA
jgi:hypothetical protein